MGARGPKSSILLPRAFSVSFERHVGRASDPGEGANYFVYLVHCRRRCVGAGVVSPHTHAHTLSHTKKEERARPTSQAHSKCLFRGVEFCFALAVCVSGDLRAVRGVTDSLSHTASMHASPATPGGCKANFRFQVTPLCTVLHQDPQRTIRTTCCILSGRSSPRFPQSKQIKSKQYNQHNTTQHNNTQTTNLHQQSNIATYIHCTLHPPTNPPTNQPHYPSMDRQHTPSTTNTVHCPPSRPSVCLSVRPSVTQSVRPSE